MTVNFSGLCYIEVILYLCLHWQINSYYIFRWIHFILYFQITGTLEICMKKFDAEIFFLQNGCFVNLDNFSDLYQIS